MMYCNRLHHHVDDSGCNHHTGGTDEHRHGNSDTCNSQDIESLHSDFHPHLMDNPLPVENQFFK